MLWLAAILLAMILYAARRDRGPLWAFAASWLVCLAPLLLGFIEYGFFDGDDVGFGLTLTAYALCFAAGSYVHTGRKRASAPFRPSEARQGEADLVASRRYARVAWLAGLAGTVCVVLDFYLQSGAGFGDLSELRAAYSEGSVSDLGRIASILTWGGLYSFGYALAHRRTLGPARFATYLIPAGGYFFVAVSSAGRQAAFQLMLFAVLTPRVIKLVRAREEVRARSRGDAIAMLLGSAAMIVYMGYVASARNDHLISSDKSEVLAVLFDARASGALELMLKHVGAGAKAAIMEGVVYFSSPIPLFSRFLTVEIASHTFGAMSLPFVFRQIEPITGISVVGALADKRDMMEATGVIGYGWTTGISSYIVDFGRVGAGIVLFIQGYLSAFAWRRARQSGGFHDMVVGILACIGAIYMPLSAPSAETNLLLLLAFCLVAGRLQVRVARAPHAAHRGAVSGTPARWTA